MRTGDAYYNLDKLAEASKSYEKALEIEPYNSEYIFDYAQVLYELDKFDEALKEVDHLVDLAPNWLEALYLKAKIHAKLNHFDEFIEVVAEITLLDPNGIQVFMEEMKDFTANIPDFEEKLNRAIQQFG